MKRFHFIFIKYRLSHNRLLVIELKDGSILEGIPLLSYVMSKMTCLWGIYIFLEKATGKVALLELKGSISIIIKLLSNAPQVFR